VKDEELSSFEHALAAQRRDRERLRLIAEALCGYAYDWDLETGLVDRAADFAAFLGFENADVPPDESWWLERIHPDDLAGPVAETRALFNDPDVSRVETEYRVRHRDGSWCRLSDHARLLRNERGEVIRMVGITFDVTKEREQQQREHEALLAAEADRRRHEEQKEKLYRETEIARAEAEAANRSKSSFLAAMSHELRTPLNAIAGYTELLEIGIHGPITPEQQKALNRIKHSERYLLSLINEVLNYARLEAGAIKYDITEIVVNDALAKAESFVLPLVRQKGLQLRIEQCDPALVMTADDAKLSQVLLNLLSNAVKFTESGGIITTTASRAGDSVEIMIADTGIGIPADHLESIFDPFVQVGRTLSSPHEGTGLGLAISRDLARGMGGELTARSTPGVGSTFTLRLPGGELPRHK
jgi:PAS domain S-box-containing protein